MREKDVKKTLAGNNSDKFPSREHSRRTPRSFSIKVVVNKFWSHSSVWSYIQYVQHRTADKKNQFRPWSLIRPNPMVENSSERCRRIPFFNSLKIKHFAPRYLGWIENNSSSVLLQHGGPVCTGTEAISVAQRGAYWPNGIPEYPGGPPLTICIGPLLRTSV